MDESTEVITMNSTLSTLPPAMTLTTAFNKYDVYPDAHVIERVWFYIVGIGGTLVGSVGLVCNCLSIGVLLHTDMRSSTPTLYLIALVVYDTTFLVLNTVFVSVEYAYFGFTGRGDWHRTYVAPCIPAINALMNVAITGSAYTTIALSLERCLSVKRPLQCSHVFTPKRVRTVLVGVFLWACVLNVPLMMETRLEWKTVPGTNETSLGPVDTEYSSSYFHTTVYLKYINPAFDAVIPVVVIAVVNIIIGMALRRRRLVARSLGADGRAVEQAGKDTVKVTLQVLIISIFTLISRALRVSTFIIMEDYGTINVNFCPLYCGVIAAVAQFWNILNASVNFFLYCYFGQKFRKCFVQIYGCCKCKTRDEEANAGSSRPCCCGFLMLRSSPSTHHVSNVLSTSSSSLRATSTTTTTTTSEGSMQSISFRRKPSINLS